MFYILCFFFNDTATTEIYTSFPTRRSSDLASRSGVQERRATRGCAPSGRQTVHGGAGGNPPCGLCGLREGERDRKSTRLNSSHANISYAVFCLKKKKTIDQSIVYYSTLSQL